jgi:lipopolysaccharide transport system permease protein
VTEGGEARRPAKEPPIFVIRPTRGFAAFDLREIWAYRELLGVLVWRDVKVRYKQTAIGVAWAVLQPVCAMLIFSAVFGRLARLPSAGVPYPAFAFCGLIPWLFFARSLTEASTSLVVNDRLVTKVYFPRILVPTAVVLAGLPDLAISLVILVGLVVAYGLTPSFALVAVPIFLLLAIATALAVSYWLSALDVEFRDVRYTLPFLTQVWMFATPVVYASSIVPPRWRTLYGLNPMTSVVEGFRWALVGTPPPHLGMMAASAGVVLFLLVTGFAYFRRVERTLVDKL